jgi:hypothetical protein
MKTLKLVLTLAFLSVPLAASNTPFWGWTDYVGGCITQPPKPDWTSGYAGCLVSINMPQGLSQWPVAPGYDGDFLLSFDVPFTGTMQFCAYFAPGDYVYVRAYGYRSYCYPDHCESSHVDFLYSYVQGAAQCAGVQ